MDCEVVYGLSCNIKHSKVIPVAEAFRNLSKMKTGWAFLNIYFNDRLVYTTQGLAGYLFICEDCPYRKEYKA